MVTGLPRYGQEASPGKDGFDSFAFQPNPQSVPSTVPPAAQPPSHAPAQETFAQPLGSQVVPFSLFLVRFLPTQKGLPLIATYGYWATEATRPRTRPRTVRLPWRDPAHARSKRLSGARARTPWAQRLQRPGAHAAQHGAQHATKHAPASPGDLGAAPHLRQPVSSILAAAGSAGPPATPTARPGSGIPARTDVLTGTPGVRFS